MSIYTYIHILFLSTRKTFSTPFRNFSSFSISILTPAGRCLRSGEMSNTLKERERIINSQGCVRKKKRERKRMSAIFRGTRDVMFPFCDFLIHPVSFVSLDGGRWLFLAINCYYGHHAWGLVWPSGTVVVVVVVVPVSSRKRSSGCVRVFLNSKILVMTGSLIVYREHEVG